MLFKIDRIIPIFMYFSAHTDGWMVPSVVDFFSAAAAPPLVVCVVDATAAAAATTSQMPYHWAHLVHSPSK